jgi:hypothetical protein
VAFERLGYARLVAFDGEQVIGPAFLHNDLRRLLLGV